MIPAGYLAKRVSTKPDWLEAARVVDIYSVSGCISEDFADYIQLQKHNGHWMFNTPEDIRILAKDESIELVGTNLFYYEVHEYEYDLDERRKTLIEPQADLETNVVVPRDRVLQGFDVVTFSYGSSPECSPLSCNSLAKEVETNAHCLLRSFEEAQRLIANPLLVGGEPGPHRIFSVYSVEWTP